MDITFVTHLRLDSEDRLYNLQTILNYYSSNVPNSNFILVEDGESHDVRFDKINWPKNRTSFFFMENPGVYHRTRALNYGFKHSKAPIVVSLDTDCVVSIDAFNKCKEALLKEHTIAWPYNGYFVDVSYKIHQDFVINALNYEIFKKYLPPADQLKLGILSEHVGVRCTTTTLPGLGGIVMFNRERIMEIGGYNEKFIGWGAEDEEIDIRCRKLGLTTYRDTGENSLLFHLIHSNSVRQTNPHYQSNVLELERVKNMNKLELLQHIKSGQ